MLRTRRRARDAISPFRRLASVAMSRRASGLRLGRASKGSSALLYSSSPTAWLCKTRPNTASLHWRPSNCSGFVCIAISGILSNFTQCLADATLLHSQIAKRSRRSRVATPAVLHGMVFLVRISSAFSHGQAGSSIAKQRTLAVLRVRENRQLQSSLVYHHSG